MVWQHLTTVLQISPKHFYLGSKYYKNRPMLRNKTMKMIERLNKRCVQSVQLYCVLFTGFNFAVKTCTPGWNTRNDGLAVIERSWRRKLQKSAFIGRIDRTPFFSEMQVFRALGNIVSQDLEIRSRRFHPLHYVPNWRRPLFRQSFELDLWSCWVYVENELLVVRSMCIIGISLW